MINLYSSSDVSVQVKAGIINMTHYSKLLHIGTVTL